jgi:ribonuclease P protein component
MIQQFTLGKAERLKSRKLIEQVFREGKSFTIFPYKVFYLLEAGREGRPGQRGAPMVRQGGRQWADSKAPLQAGFGASIRHFGRAVDRNRIKRLGREAYRVQKQALLDRLREKRASMAVFFVYTGKELPDHHTVTGKIGVILQKLIRETA